MSDQPPRPTHSIEFWRTYDTRRPYLVATTRTDEGAAAHIQLVRPYSDGSGDEVLAALTTGEWTELVVFLAQHSVSVAAILEELERRGVYARDTQMEATP